jgi:hypothetical protein
MHDESLNQISNWGGIAAEPLLPVAVVTRPASQDGVDLLELLAKTDLGSATPSQQLDLST